MLESCLRLYYVALDVVAQFIGLDVPCQSGPLTRLAKACQVRGPGRHTQNAHLGFESKVRESDRVKK